MVWTAPVPDAVVALRTMLVACASAVSAGLAEARFHYPTATMNGSSADTRMLAVLDQVSFSRNKYAEGGVLGNPTGTITCTIFSDSDTISTMESLAEDLCSELLSQSTGLSITSAVPSRASDPTPGQRAAEATTADNTAQFRSVTLTIDWGLSP